MPVSKEGWEYDRPYSSFYSYASMAAFAIALVVLWRFKK
jgi:hypothetical protein